MMLGDTTYTFVIIKNPKHDPKEPYIYFISDMQDARSIANHYLKRWKIECCFKHLKSNGFNIEDINLKMDNKIELMMAVLAMVYIMAVKEGLLSHQVDPIPLKKYKDGKMYLSISIFRMGLAIIQTLLATLNNIIEYIGNHIKSHAEWGYEDNKDWLLIKNV